MVVAVTEDDESLYSRAIKVASGLRAASYRVDLLLQPKRMKSILQTADRMHVMNVIIFSPHEAQGGNTNALLRSMGDGHQEIVSDDELVKTLDWWRMKALN